MGQTFSSEELLTYLCTRWRFLAIACAIALIGSVAISLMLPKQYTARVSIVIDPPASSDPRAATAISPVYLESLRTYESFAEGDALFAGAVERFQLRASSDQPVETLKRKILRVSKLKESKILQISATLPEPQKAAEVAQYVAAEVVKLSQKTGSEIDLNMLRNTEGQLNHLQDVYREALRQLTAYGAQFPVDSLQAEIDSMDEAASRVMRDALQAEADAEDYAARERAMTNDPSAAEQLRLIRQETIAERARVVVLQRQSNELRKILSAKGAEIGKRTSERARLDTAVKIAQNSMEAEDRHAREVRDASGVRGDVLTIIDPGIVPQRPSSPNIALNMAISLFVAMVASLFYLAVAFGRARSRNENVQA